MLTRNACGESGRPLAPRWCLGKRVVGRPSRRPRRFNYHTGASSHPGWDVLPHDSEWGTYSNLMRSIARAIHATVTRRRTRDNDGSEPNGNDSNNESGDSYKAGENFVGGAVKFKRASSGFEYCISFLAEIAKDGDVVGFRLFVNLRDLFPCERQIVWKLLCRFVSWFHTSQARLSPKNEKAVQAQSQRLRAALYQAVDSLESVILPGSVSSAFPAHSSIQRCRPRLAFALPGGAGAQCLNECAVPHCWCASGSTSSTIDFAVGVSP